MNDLRGSHRANFVTQSRSKSSNGFTVHICKIWGEHRLCFAVTLPILSCLSIPSLAGPWHRINKVDGWFDLMTFDFQLFTAVCCHWLNSCRPLVMICAWIETCLMVLESSFESTSLKDQLFKFKFELNTIFSGSSTSKAAQELSAHYCAPKWLQQKTETGRNQKW